MTVNATIAIVEYDPVWPSLFEQEAKRIRVVLPLWSKSWRASTKPFDDVRRRSNSLRL